ncbi:MAG: PHP domain-containing protein, partial [Bacteroidia bacterium]|nr:PHP domain-containing protein [Bacteroidia bacterium]
MYLNCHTGFSFKYGTLPIKTLFEEAKRCGIHKLALTEINNTSSYLEMLRICDTNRPIENGLTKFGKEAYDLTIAVGVEFRNQNDLLYIAIAKNNQGFEAINRFLSFHNREAKPFPTRAPEFENAFIIYPFGKIEPDQLREHEYIGVDNLDLSSFSLYPQREEYAHKFVLLHPVTFLPPEKFLMGKTKKGKMVYRDHNTHRLLRCIANNTLLSKLPEQHQASKEEFMLSEEDLKKPFEQFPYLLRNAKSLLDQCSLECKLGEDKNKKFFTHSLEEDLKYLRDKTEKGYALRYGKDKTVWDARIEKELSIITKKKFTSYYLI